MSAYTDEITHYYACCDGDEPECNTLGDEQYDSHREAETAANEHDEEYHA